MIHQTGKRGKRRTIAKSIVRLFLLSRLEKESAVRNVFKQARRKNIKTLLKNARAVPSDREALSCKWKLLYTKPHSNRKNSHWSSTAICF